MNMKFDIFVQGFLNTNYHRIFYMKCLNEDHIYKTAEMLKKQYQKDWGLEVVVEITKCE